MSNSKQKIDTTKTVKSEEYLARFLNQKNKFSKNKVKHSAFYPPKGTSTTSVFRHDNYSHDKLIEIGKNQKIIIKAIASVQVKNIISLTLSVVSDTTGNQHPKHAHIVFPIKNNSEENFHKIKYICMDIAKHANLIKDSNNNILCS